MWHRPHGVRPPLREHTAARLPLSYPPTPRGWQLGLGDRAAITGPVLVFWSTEVLISAGSWDSFASVATSSGRPCRLHWELQPLWTSDCCGFGVLPLPEWGHLCGG